MYSRLWRSPRASPPTPLAARASCSDGPGLEPLCAQLLLPVGPLEKAGSESLQGVLDKQIAPVLELWREGYTKWAACN